MLDKTSERVLPSYDDPKKLADEFNHFYINKVTKIRDSIPETTNKSYYARPFTGEMMTKFKIVTEEEVEKLIKSNGIKTCMEDPIPAKLLQQSLPHFGCCLAGEGHCQYLLWAVDRGEQRQNSLGKQLGLT